MPTRAEQREATRTAILDAAESAFAEEGFAGARVDGIARGAGIRRATLFHHFLDKKALYSSVIERSAASYFDSIGALLDEIQGTNGGDSPTTPVATPHEIITRSIFAQARYFSDHTQVARIILREIVDHDADRPSVLGVHVAKLFSRITQFVADVRDDAAYDPVDPQTIITTLAGAVLFQVTMGPALPLSADAADARLVRHEQQLAVLFERLIGLAPES
jgi:AcrR family transcriptional regulator